MARSGLATVDEDCNVAELRAAVQRCTAQPCLRPRLIPDHIRDELPELDEDEYSIQLAILTHEPAEFPLVSQDNLRSVLSVPFSEKPLLLVRTQLVPPLSITIFDAAADELIVQLRAQHPVTTGLPEHMRRYAMYLAPRRIWVTPPETLREAVRRLHLASLQKVSMTTPLEIIRRPWAICAASKPADEDSLRALSIIERRKTYFLKRPTKPPSSEAQPHRFYQTQKNEDVALYCGRPYEATTPPTLLDATLCQLRHDISHIVPSANDIQCFNALRAEAVQLYKLEPQRRTSFSRVLREGGTLPDWPLRGRASKHDNGGDLRVSRLGAEFLYYIQAVQLEVSQGTTEPFIEAIHRHMEHIRIINGREPGDMAKTNFPAVILLNFGPYLAVAAAAFTDKPVAEHLACVPLHVHSTNADELARGQRVLAALRVALHDLKTNYPAPGVRGPPADCPFHDFYEDADGTRHALTYDGPVEGARAYAHRAAHRTGFAPALYALNNVGGWLMAVMEDKSAAYTSLWDLKQNGETPVDDWDAAFEWVQRAVEEQLALLFEAGYVHGDVRDTNVLVRDADGERDVLLVDWDWAGVNLEARHPPNMSREGIPRPEDASPGGLIAPEHDMWMVEHLLDWDFP
ncbi:hypothetical protein GLOTRDRAFT_131641 [Gloeophyllum trabeum ATCC 11539]|uniref:Protein kinase domain-containing protein n=1 Tax=Gloeophyllum trabeum (strain ATCC 11539 / FP-39264 / Madison 617) TaxID=670483 RepID=S7Q1H7_GLOTA|nr:uncharacterized protein GLOTRDRAFT_131641 [Gloeophyllum trabeum ATCC 11539]EPQ53372.1 hypothetical protein GLOTRDRAFT_131641 [Gloeophyllum trabeum ATCC 11539]